MFMHRHQQRMFSFTDVYLSIALKAGQLQVGNVGYWLYKKSSTECARTLVCRNPLLHHYHKSVMFFRVAPPNHPKFESLLLHFVPLRTLSWCTRWTKSPAYRLQTRILIYFHLFCANKVVILRYGSLLLEHPSGWKKHANHLPHNDKWKLDRRKIVAHMSVLNVQWICISSDSERCATVYFALRVPLHTLCTHTYKTSWVGCAECVLLVDCKNSKFRLIANINKWIWCLNQGTVSPAFGMAETTRSYVLFMGSLLTFSSKTMYKYK